MRVFGGVFYKIPGSNITHTIFIYLPSEEHHKTKTERWQLTNLYRSRSINVESSSSQSPPLYTKANSMCQSYINVTESGCFVSNTDKSLSVNFLSQEILL